MKSIIIVLFLVLLSSCATKYKKDGYSGGYSSIQLNENIYRVSFNGNGYTKKQRSADFALLRAAEITLERGFTHFQVLGETNDVTTSTYTQPAHVSTNINMNSYNYGNSSNINGTSHSTITGGNTKVYHKPSSTLVIKMINNPKFDNVYNADIISNSVKSQYNIIQ